MLLDAIGVDVVDGKELVLFALIRVIGL